MALPGSALISLADIVERFAREANVAAAYVPAVSNVRLPPHVCGEIVRMVPEALVNVRRHSGARHAVVRFCAGAKWSLSIEDDGRGFAATRRTVSGSGSRIVRPPAVIHDRVRAIGGTVRVVGTDPLGARLDIAGRWPSRRRIPA